MQGKHDEVLPVNLELVPSLDCNLRCPPCTYATWKRETAADQGRRKMPYEHMVELMDKVEAAGIRGLTVTGGGEPFANPDTIRGLEYAASKEFDTGLFSNGTLLDLETIERLADIGLCFIRFSFNSGECNNYLNFHGISNPAVFEKIRENITLLGSALYGSNTTFGLGMIVNELNCEYMLSVAEFVRQLFESHADFKLDYITYRPVLNYGQVCPDLKRQITPEIANLALENFERVEKVVEGLPVELKISGDYFFAAGQATQKLERGYRKCIGSSWCGSIAYDGALYLCSERNGNLGYWLGDLHKCSLAEIWDSQRRANVIRDICGCGPACKVHRINLLLHALTAGGKLNESEIEEFQVFLDVMRSCGEPEKLSFLSW